MDNNHFENLFKTLNVSVSQQGMSVHLDFTEAGRKLDIAQDALDSQVWQDVQKYMPIDTGNLISQTNALNQTVRGMVYMFDPNVEYAHYQYEGKLYVDPVYQKGAFYSPEYGFWSRKGVEKVKTNTPLNYSNPRAQAHWADVAIQNHRDEWVRTAKRALK